MARPFHKYPHHGVRLRQRTSSESLIIGLITISLYWMSLIIDWSMCVPKIVCIGDWSTQLWLVDDSHWCWPTTGQIKPRRIIGITLWIIDQKLRLKYTHEIYWIIYQLKLKRSLCRIHNSRDINYWKSIIFYCYVNFTRRRIYTILSLQINIIQKYSTILLFVHWGAGRRT